MFRPEEGWYSWNTVKTVKQGPNHVELGKLRPNGLYSQCSVKTPKGSAINKINIFKDHFVCCVEIVLNGGRSRSRKSSEEASADKRAALTEIIVVGLEKNRQI